MTPPPRRGACPELLQPMQTGDGLLVRLPPLHSALPLDTAAALCAAARAHGNGIVEISRRGSIQIRGLRPDSAAAFAEVVLGLGIAPGSGPPILVSPLAGADAAEALDVRGIAAELRQRLECARWTPALGPKVSIAIDGGGALHMDGLDADVRLRAARSGSAVSVHAAVGGDGARATALGALPLEAAAQAGAALLEHIASHGAAARARDLLRSHGSAGFRAAIASSCTGAPPPAPRAECEPIGTHRLRDGALAIGVGFAFGQTDAIALERLLGAAARAGAQAVQPAERHSLLLIGLTPPSAQALATEAAQLGFAVRAADPRRHIAACAGAPACAGAQMPARSVGAAVARAAAALLDGSLTLHLSGCAKGCAHPGAAPLTLVGMSDGFALVVAGSAQSAPLGIVPAGALAERLAELGTWVGAAAAPGERSAQVLARAGGARIAQILCAGAAS